MPGGSSTGESAKPSVRLAARVMPLEIQNTNLYRLGRAQLQGTLSAEVDARRPPGRIRRGIRNWA